jgi:hypothetical protein
VRSNACVVTNDTEEKAAAQDSVVCEIPEIRARQKRPRNKGRRAIRGMRCVARSGGTSAGRQMAVILGRVAGVPPVRRGALRWLNDSVSAIFSLNSEHLSNSHNYENKGVEAVKYTKVVHFSE